MSTVDKRTADMIVAGKFPEYSIVAIIKYYNVFGGKSYKLIFPGQKFYMQEMLDGNVSTMRNCSVYWKKGE